MIALEDIKSTKFTYNKLPLEEQKARGILGRLTGIIASVKEPTRNGRTYSKELWEKAFNDPLMQEKIKTRCVLGELGHPAERSEIDIEKVAICLAETPKYASDGNLYGIFDILDTPNGRILKTLCDYGSIIGVSSRGQGDLVQDYQGNESVDPDTYSCECWDAVLVPAVESARMKYIKEDFDLRVVKLKKALNESFNKASEEEKKIMENTLKDLNIKFEDKEIPEVKPEEVESKETQPESKDAIEIVNDPELDKAVAELEEKGIVPTDKDSDESNDEESEDEEKEISLGDVAEFIKNNFEEKDVKKVFKILKIDSDESEDEKESDEDDIEKVKDKEIDEKEEEAVDNGNKSLVENLKDALKVNVDLEGSVKNLNEKLAVSNTKVDGLNEECDKYKSALTRLSLLAKNSKDLKEQLSTLTEAIKEKDKQIDSQKLRITRLAEARKQAIKGSDSISESVTIKEKEIASLNESLNSSNTESKKQIGKLNEELTQLKAVQKDRDIKITTLKEDLNKASSIKESYKKLANKAVDKYINIKANVLGMTPVDIKRKLGETYTIEDVDQVCEDLKAYQLNLSKLPWDMNRKVSIKFKENVGKNLVNKSIQNDDDAVDEGLIKLANI